MDNRNQNHERGSIAGAIWGLVLLSIAALIPYFIFGKTVLPNQIGVRQNYFSFLYVLKKGYSAEGLAPGLHWQIPGVSDVILLDRDFTFIHFSGTDQNADDKFRSLDILTTDGPKVTTDIAVALRLFDSTDESAGASETPLAYEALPESDVPLTRALKLAHGGPRQLIDTYTGDVASYRNRIAKRAENALKSELSELSAAGFYHPALREQRALDAQEELAKTLAPDGVELFGVFIQRYLYEDTNIDQNIFEKNLQDQTERLNAAASEFAAAQALTEQVSANWDAKITDLKVSGESAVRVIRSSGDLERAKKVAEADLLVAEARARVDQSKAEVLSGSTGAENYLSREMAPILGTLKGGIITGIDPFQINQWMERLGASRGGNSR